MILDERKIINNNHNRDHDITSKDLDDVFLRIIPCKTASPVEIKKNKDRFFVCKSVPDYSLSKGNNNYNIDTQVKEEKKEEKVVSKIQRVDTRDDLISKLLFVRQSSSTKLSCHICQKTFQQKSQTQMVIRTFVTLIELYVSVI